MPSESFAPVQLGSSEHSSYTGLNGKNNVRGEQLSGASMAGFILILMG